MKKSLLLVTLFSLFFCSIVYASSNTPTTFLGPTVKFGTGSYITDLTAYSVFAEVGPREARVSGTLAWQLAENQRIKFTTELLGQYLTFGFYSGNVKQFVAQGTLGGDYVYEFVSLPYVQFDMNGYLNYARGKDLNDVIVINEFAVQQGAVLTNITETINNVRHIAGSKGFGLAPGVWIHPWWGTKMGFNVVYDNISYDTKYSNQNPKGFGFMGRWDEYITDDLELSFVLEDREPFNHYGGALTWSHIPYLRGLELSLYGDYTKGKEGLPNSYNIGVSANYLLEKCPTVEYLPYRNAKGEVIPTRMTEPEDLTESLLAWAADPAVYMPQVLAVADEQLEVINVCQSATLINTLTNPVLPAGGGPIPVITAGTVFTGTPPLTFSMVAVNSNPSISNALAINPLTGAIAGSVINSGAIAGNTTVRITATNACGSATTYVAIIAPAFL